MSEDPLAGTTETGVSGDEDFSQMDDSALLSRRSQMRDELERLPQGSPGHAVLAALYDRSTLEVDDRARRAWARTGKADK
jgi:hypothetical protein